MKRIVKYLFIVEIDASTQDEIEKHAARVPQEVGLHISGGGMEGLYRMQKVGMYRVNETTKETQS